MILLDDSDNCFSGKQEDFPSLTSVFVRGHVPVNPEPQLGAFRDDPTDGDFWSCAKRTSENFEGDVAFLERPEE